MKQITLEELLEAGCHFGHQVQRQNPKARDYIFEARDGIHIIDLAKTKEGLESAGEFIKEKAAQDGTIIIVGTKRQAQPIVIAEIERAKKEGATGIFFVTHRWIGGTLTNVAEVSKNYKKLKDLTKMLKDEDQMAKYTKRELGLFEKERQKLELFYGGIDEMTQKPTVMFIVDTHTEVLAVREARAENIPTVGITDTNADPLIIDHPIPANDDAVGSLQLLISYIMDAWIEGKKEGNKPVKVENKEVREITPEQKSPEAEPKKKVTAKEKKSKELKGE